MWILLIPAAAIVGAWIYGASKVGQPIQHDQEPHEPVPPPGSLALGLLTLKIGDKIIVDIDKAGLSGSGFTGPAAFQTTGAIDALAGSVRAKSIDSRFPNNPLGIGDQPIPIPVSAITAVNP